jgi:hypothetical protein
MRYALVVQCVFSRYIWAFPTTTIDGDECARILQEKVFEIYGSPRVLVSDQGFAFTSNVVEAIMLMNNTRHCFTTAYHPQANPVERVNRVLKERLRAMCTNTRDWEEHLRRIVNAFNRSIHSSTDFAPFVVFFGREPMSPTKRMLLRGDDSKYQTCRQYVDVVMGWMAYMNDEVVKANQAAWEKAKIAYDKRHRVWKECGDRRGFEYKIGDKVWIAVPMKGDSEAEGGTNRGLQPRWKGPLQVISRMGDTYRVRVPTGGALPMPYHSNLMRPYLPNQKRKYTRPSDDVDTSGIDWDEAYEGVIERAREVGAPQSTRSGKTEKAVIGSRLSKIVGHDGKPRKEWKVRYSDGQALWVDESQVKSRKLINDYRAMTGAGRQ